MSTPTRRPDLARGRHRVIGALVALLATVLVATSMPAAAQDDERPFEGRTLRVMLDAFREAWDVALWTEDFEEASGATIEWTYVPFEGLDARYASLIAAQDPTFDAITAIVTTAPAFRDILFEDLTGLVDQEILDDARGADRVGDATYSVAIGDGSHLFYWNKDRYAAAGLDPEAAPETFEELFQHCEALRTAFPDDFCFDWEMSDPNTTYAYWLLLLNAADGQMYNEDLTQVAFDGPEGLAAVETMNRIFEYADPAGYQIPSQDETGRRFAQAETSTNFNWDNTFKRVMLDPEQSTLVDEQIGISIIPGVGEGRSGSFNGWEGYGINTYSENKDLAAAFIEYVLGREAQLKFVEELGVGTGRISFIDDPEFSPDRAAQVTAEQMQYTVERYGSGYSAAVNEVFDVTLNKMRSGELTPEETLAELAANTQSTIDQYYAR